MARFLNKISLSRKMAMILLIGFLLPMLTYSVITISRLRDQGESELKQVMNQTLEHVRMTLDMQVSDAVSLALTYATDTDLSEVLDATYLSDYRYWVKYQESIRPTLTVSPVYGSIKWVRIYTDNPTVVSGSMVANTDITDYSFGENAEMLDVVSIPSQDMMLRVSLQSSITANRLDVSLVRTMNTMPAFRHYNRVLRVSLNISNMEAGLKELDAFDEVMLLDYQNRVLISSRGNVFDGKYLRVFDRESYSSDDTLLELPLSTITSLRLVGVYHRSTLADMYLESIKQYTLLAAVLTVIGLLLSVLLGQTITGRIRQIGQAADKIAMGNFTQMDEEVMGTDEVGRLAMAINRMSSQLRQRIENEYAARLRQAKLQRENARAELNALQSQVNPHFMFNAMEAIRIKARARGEQETARMIMYMARMFRRLLDWHDEAIPLSDEMAFINEYLSIQSYRYDDDFSFNVDVDPALMDTFIPKMLLQPLVENACVHGLSSDAEKREGALTIVQVGGDMLITVEDHGEGMTLEQLEGVRMLLRLGDNSIHSVGLRNVERRCRLYYDKAAKLDAHLREGGGSVFTMQIPIRRHKEDFNVSHTDRR